MSTMKFIDTLKRWLGLATPSASSKPVAPVEPKTMLLPNGRTALVDDSGNFIGFKD